MIKHTPGKTFITAHRGVSGADIPCNTKTAFQIALAQGADIIELDVTKSLDGNLFVFHPGMESAHLSINKRLSELTTKEISELRFTNQDNVPTLFEISTLEDMFNFLKDKPAYINVDKYWMFMEEITHCIRKCGVDKQVIVKTEQNKSQIDQLEKIAPDLAVMPVISSDEDFTDYALSKNVNYIGAELLFSTESSPLVSDEYIKKMHSKGLVVYGNAIVYDCRAVISAGHTDNRALQGDLEGGWGWFVDKKFDVIQTDWCLMLKNYLANRK